MASECFIQKFPDPIPVPSLGMGKPGVERKVAFVKFPGGNSLSLRTINGKVKNGQIQKINTGMMAYNEVKGFLRFRQTLRRSPEEKIDIGRNSCPFERSQNPGG